MSDGRVLDPLTPEPSATVPASVYPAREDTALLLPFAELESGGWLLDVGCGNGALALHAASERTRVVATDLNPHALRFVLQQAGRQGKVVRPVRTDLANGLGRFDRIVSNPPYLPTPSGLQDPDPWHHIALDGGPDGLATTRRILGSLPDHLNPGADAYLIFSSLQDGDARDALRDDWSRYGGRWTSVARRDLGGETLTVERIGCAAAGEGDSAGGTRVPSPRR